MPNVVREQRLVDSTNRAVIKYVVISDGTAEANTRLLDASSLAFSLNANGKILGAGSDVRPGGYGLTIKKIFGSCTSKHPGHVRLQWEGAANSEIITFGGNGNFDFNFDSSGLSAVISNPEANATGDILYTTDGMASGDTFTLFLEIKKSGRDFDQGQTADPAAFNR